MLKHIKKIISAFILTAIVFAFLHSEAGLLDYDDSNHGAHDYCELIKDINAHSNIQQQRLPRIEFNDASCFYCFEKNETQTVQTSFEIEDQNLKANPSTDLYLFNRTFLI